MAPSAFSYDYWLNDSSESGVVGVDCLMPNSIVIHLDVNRETTLLDLKEVRISVSYTSDVFKSVVTFFNTIRNFGQKRRNGHYMVL